MQLRSHLGRVRGLGSSNDGVNHWWMQRLTGVALVPLCLWFVFSIVSLVDANLSSVTNWVGRHFNPVLLVLLVICMFYHAQLGLQVVIEDYIHSELTKVMLLVGIKLGALFLGACSAFAVIRLTFGG